MSYNQLTQVKRYHISALLKSGLSQKEIAKEVGVSPSKIYRYIYVNGRNGGRLYKHLRHKNRKYHKRGRIYENRGALKNRTMIEKRPRVVEKKRRIGDWEIDTVIGKNHQGILVTAVDRHSKFTLIAPASSKHAVIVKDALLRLLEPVKAVTKTITSDNGKEFALHETIAEQLDAGFYFANPYHSWERGLNEHTNGLIRQYLPKNRELTGISNKEIAMIQSRLNHRPRKVLGYKTPYELFFSKLVKELEGNSVA
jgi:IS30 family transposase